MSLFLRAINYVLLALGILGGASNFFTKKHGSAEEAIGSIIGLALWLIPCAMALWAANKKDASTARRGRSAQWLLGGLGVVLAAMGLFISEARGFFLVFGAVVIALAYFNHRAMSRLVDSADAAPRVIPQMLDGPSMTQSEMRTLSNSTITSHVLTEATPSQAALASASTGNYLVRHWRGDLSLGRSYWINTVLAGVVVVAVPSLLLAQWTDAPLRLAAALSLVLFSTAALQVIWSIVGTWRSASKHERRGGSAGASMAARALLVIGALSTIGHFGNSVLPQAKEYWKIAIGQDDVGELTARLSADGKSLLLAGALPADSAKKVNTLLDSAPGVTVLSLDLKGGRVGEASVIADLVRKRGMSTYVENICVSACTLIFLAGQDRAAVPNAKIGFHKYSFPGLTAEQERRVETDFRKRYRDAGLTDAFIARAWNTSAESMWYPTREELINSRVITRLSLGSETGSLGLLVKSRADLALALRSVDIFRLIEEHYPQIFNKAMDIGWAKVQARASDADTFTAIRAVVSDVQADLISKGSDAEIEGWAQLILDQLRAAREISPEVCEALLDSRLNIVNALPPELVKREAKLLTDALTAGASKRAVAKKNDVAAAAGIQQIVRQMSPLDVDTLQKVERGLKVPPGMRCGAIDEMYTKALRLPPRVRADTLRALFNN